MSWKKFAEHGHSFRDLHFHISTQAFSGKINVIYNTFSWSIFDWESREQSMMCIITVLLLFSLEISEMTF
jgi:hypothetical protein